MDASGGWRSRALCRDSPIDFTANMEAQEPPEDAAAVCDLCPVRVECLDYALQLDLWGCWGRTSYWQRRQLRRRYRRAMCPVCRVEGGVLLELGGGQACLTCAVSWRATPARLPAGG